MEYVRLWWRGFVLVMLTAMNVGTIAHHRPESFVTGFLVSWVWWQNAHSAAHMEMRGARFTYAFGAACGTSVGILVTELMYGG